MITQHSPSSRRWLLLLARRLSGLVAVLLVLADGTPAAAMVLEACRIRLEPDKGRFVAQCDLSASLESIEALGAGATLELGDRDSTPCIEETVSLERRGRCWKASRGSGSTVRQFRVCENPRTPGRYVVTLRIGGAAARERFACLDDPEVTFAIRTTTDIVEIPCDHDPGENTCRVLAVTESQCRHNGSTDCSTPAVVDCDPAPFNCEQPTKSCDPRPRTARRDNPRLQCFPAPSGTPVTDSLGNQIGRLTEDRVRLNFGAHRIIGGERKVMAFSVSTDVGARTGWISLSAVGNVPTDFLNTPPRPAAPGPLEVLMIVPDGWSEHQRNLRTKCTAGTDAGSAWHYLGRDNGTVNLVWNTPGLGSPTIEVYPNNQKLTFYRSGVRSVEMPLYDCANGARAGTLTFVYGRVEADRWGWIATPNLARPCGNGRIDPGEECDGGAGCEATCYFTRYRCEVQCCDTSWAPLVMARSPEECLAYAGSGQMCRAQGNWTNAFFNGAHHGHSPCPSACGIECCSWSATQRAGGVVKMRAFNPGDLRGTCTQTGQNRCAVQGSGVRNLILYPQGVGGPIDWYLKSACPSVP